MRRVLVLLFSFATVSCYSQKKVSEEFAGYKLRMDSLMRITYGDSIFENYFVFDTSSYIWVGGHTMHSWNETYTGDSVTAVEFWYVFVYPGAYIHPYYGYRPGSTIFWIFEDSLDKYDGRCITIAPAAIEQFAKTKLKQPLNQCAVRLRTDTWFSANEEFIHLDSSHVYLEMEYQFTKGGEHRGAKFKQWNHIILIDACTGEYVGRKDTYTSGVKGAHF
jgi:hypothetical protein